MFLRTAAIPFLLVGLPASAQSLTVQQPAFESFSVGTTVSVPDRGRVSLGGVGRAASGRTSRGFLPSGSSYARSVSGSSIDAGVFIHDFEAMDAAVLDAANGSAPRPAYTKTRYSDATSYAMHRRFQASGRRQPSGALGRESRDQSRVSSDRSTPAARTAALDDADRLLALGEAAAKRGKPGLAALHYKAAAAAGSAEAARRLEALTPQRPAAPGTLAVSR